MNLILFFPLRVYGPILYPYLVTNWKLFWTSAGTLLIYFSNICTYVYILYIYLCKTFIKRLVINNYHFIQIFIFHSFYFENSIHLFILFRDIYSLIHFIQRYLFINSFFSETFIHQFILFRDIYSSIHFIKRYLFVNSFYQEISIYQFILLRDIYLSIHFSKRYLFINSVENEEKFRFFQIFFRKL